jgi:hypothetical protein
VLLLVTTACSELVHTKQIPKETLENLKKQFLMSDVLEIVKNKEDMKSVASYFNTNSKRYNHIASQKQGDMNVEGYSVIDLSSPIIGYSLFFHKESDSLVIVDASVNPLNGEAQNNATLLIGKAFDSVAAGGDSMLYFLGLYDLDSKRQLKIMVREAITPMGPDYAIRYSISSK